MAFPHRLRTELFKCPVRMASWSLRFLVLGYPTLAKAGPIGVISALFTAIYWFIGIVICLSVIALVLCKFIRNRRLRAFSRLLILVFLYTPLSIGNTYLPAFMTVLGSVFGASQSAPHVGFAAHPMALGYATTLGITLPIVVAGMSWLERRKPRPVIQN
jgi:hypothetical protein